MWPFSSKQGDDATPDTAQQQLSSSTYEQARKDYIARRTPLLEEPESVPPVLEESSTDKPDTTLQDYIHQPQRLGLHPSLRCFAIGTVSFFSGFALGSAQGTTNAALRFRAENAHHVPTSKAGWYLYGKSRNYHAIIGGVTEGIKVGSRLTGWTLVFLAIEEGLDRARGHVLARSGEEERRGQKDVINTVSAAVALSGIYGRWNNLDRFAAMRLTRSGLRFAIPYGLAQDMLSSLRGDRPWYVDWIMRHTVERAKQEVII